MTHGATIISPAGEMSRRIGRLSRSEENDRPIRLYFPHLVAINGMTTGQVAPVEPSDELRDIPNIINRPLLRFFLPSA